LTYGDLQYRAASLGAAIRLQRMMANLFTRLILNKYMIKLSYTIFQNSAAYFKVPFSQTHFEMRGVTPP